ncbi:MAG: phosphoenolpyruvate mutase [Oscillospiraceae bacterium]|nr:phosphoenolpyruvate mutase [Oscillospiraceae bacterium]
MKTVYTCFTTDVIHEGHRNIIRQAQKYGQVVVGVLADEAMVCFDRFPTISFAQRMALAQGLEGVSRVVVQKDILYDEIIRELRPDYVVHGDNWCAGPMKAIRDNVERLLGAYGGTIVDVPYTRSEEVSRIDRRIRERAAMPEFRRKRLRQLLSLRPVVKAMEAHSGLTGLIVEKTVVEQDGRLDQFDAMWVSSLCDSTAKGKPDIELVDLSSRLRTIDDIMEVTTKPIILDGDTGGLAEHFLYNVRTLERMGVSAVIIEDKQGLKKNSLFGTEVRQTQDSIENFSEKIRTGKRAQLTDDFMIIARIESLILERGMDDALKRAEAFTKAGADGIMIHSRRREPDEIFEFCGRFRASDSETPLVVVPTSFNAVTEEELAAHGVNLVIYANQLTRSAFPAMQQTAEDILRFHRAREVDQRLMPIRDIITLIDEL